ncbi:maleylpyruvate isomerase family mycothiol-dependent enzyme [Nocardiopsis alborubida]|uniref:Maleylpyruvate isomerase family mycothiol-dependent enzyme n=1 Tax=Nocardiopsis alborubida TaxID=146802 RepID=A0A7X6MAW0_9ACTN|nr:maleylpyruvate isomerase family mycothiol-dependent enzyme [Nocardiopsis alborubida]NKY97204.1 maleylpyruvate isomerase family mycothiol-dependent enzyme [Nocardiopsis alborubida]
MPGRRQTRPPLVLPRTEVLEGIESSLTRFVGLVDSLSEQEWTAPTRCEGWQVRDVAGHVAGLFADVAVGRMRGQGLPEVTARQAAERHDRTPAEVAGELARAGRLCLRVLDGYDDDAWAARAPGGFPGPLRRAVLVLWYELYLHADDVRHALRRSSEHGPGLRASVVHVAETLGLWGWGPATLKLTDLEELPIRGGGPEVTGEPLDFLLTATGRRAPELMGLDKNVNVYREVVS